MTRNSGLARDRRQTLVWTPVVTAGALTLALLAPPIAGCGSKHDHAGPDMQLLTAEDLSGRLSRPREPLTLVHVWATWCAPCRKEFPRLVRFREAYDGRGVTMILISADAPDKREQVVSYLAGQGASFPSFIITNPNAAFINTLCTNWSGAIPASFFFGTDGKLREWWEGEAEYDRYEETARRLLGNTDKRRVKE